MAREKVEFTLNFKSRLLRYEVSRLVSDDLVPNRLSLLIRHIRLALLKAFEESRYMTSTFPLRLRMVVHLFTAASRLVIQK